MKKEEILNFANKWINKFNDENINYIEMADSSFGDECIKLGFTMDCGKSFEENYPNVFYDLNELKKYINIIDNIELLGNAIFSKWRYYHHWVYDSSIILEENNKKWFIIALTRLINLVK